MNLPRASSRSARRLSSNSCIQSAGPVDLIIAATAEQERPTVLCDDRDFEVVASVTHQRVRLVTDV